MPRANGHRVQHGNCDLAKDRLMNDITISNLRYVSADNSLIDMDVAGFVEGETIPFTYHASDESQLSSAVAALLAQGSYQIAAYEVPAPTAADLVVYANAKQWALATGGRLETVGGQAIMFATTMDSMTLMAGKVQRLHQPNPPTVINWQTGPTSFIAIPAADFEVAATAIADFVQSTFDALPAIFAGIQSGAITSQAQIDAALAAI
jgi:hypothetical protein